MMLGSGALIALGFVTGCGHKDSKEILDAKAIFPQSVASGDPRSDSVVLWTRIEDFERRREDLSVTLEVSLNEDFKDILLKKELMAYHEYNHAVKIKIDQLDSYTYYYYRFKYNGIYSNTGRTKTAPLAEEERDIRFAYISCQDYIGRYYNVFAHMLQQDDLDFIVHLGDYIYETNGEPLSQIKGEERQIRFRDQEGTIKFDGYEAARSIDNYRQLYQVYRSDPLLQKLHERFPMIAIWDDHEFSDDNYGPNSNYFANRVDEHDIERFHNAQRVYLEYMPMEVGLDASGVMSPESEVILDDDNEVIIYRHFNFGSNLDLILSDYRSYRPDHLIKEDAFPATVFADKDTLITNFGDVFYSDPEHQKYFGAYINIETYHNGKFLSVLRKIAKLMYGFEGLSSPEAEERANKAIRGNVNTYYCNEMIKAYNNSSLGFLDKQELIYEDDSVLDQMDKGLAYINAGKIDLFSSTGIGARYMVVKEVFDIYIKLKQIEGSIGSVYGEDQEKWIFETLAQTSSNWRVYASSVSMAPMIVDLSSIEEMDPALKMEFYVNLDQFDGFKFQRDLLLEELRAKPSVVISGDIHSTFVTDHHGVVEFTGASVSSCTFSEALPKYIATSDIVDYIDNIEEIVENLDFGQLLLDSNHAQYSSNPDFSLMKTVDMKSNAYIVIEVNAEYLRSNIYSIAAERSVESLYETENINDYFSLKSFTVKKNDMSLL
jgi:alkaline phosphatase D